MSPAPEYPRIVAALRNSIATGQSAPGSLMPSEGELAARFGVARNTLRRALSELEGEGLVIVVPGKGRLVRAAAGAPSQAVSMLPRYQRIAAELRGQIERGTYAPGGRLPSEASLGRRYGVSRETVRRALAQLRAAGLVSVVHGKGWFARPDATGPSGTS
jgi:DNA-binding GntR family transcriptional regulator